MNTLQKYQVGKIRINAISRKDIFTFLKDNINKRNGYICVTNTRTAYLSDKDSSYAEIQNSSLLTIPDGMPIVWLGKLKGGKNIERTAGPEIFQSVLESEDHSFKHYLLGDTQEILEQLKDKCIKEYEANIVGAYSPDFLSIEEYNYKEIAENINRSGANIVWLALGSPKQDIFASKLVPYTDNKIIMNVGAAFRFILGEYKMPSKMIQKAGFTGVYWRFLKRPSLFLTQYPKYALFIIKNALIKN